MLESRLKRIYLYLFGFVLLGFMFVASYAVTNKPKMVSAGGDPPPPSCSISFVSRNGTAATFQITVHNFAGSGQTGNYGTYFWNYSTGTYYYAANPQFNGYHTYDFAYGSTNTIRAAMLYGINQGNPGVSFSCSMSYTMPPPPNIPSDGWVRGSCSAAGRLDVQVYVHDANGGTPGFYLYIDNVGQYGWDYGGSGWRGAWYPPRDGVTHKISILLVDPQTGGGYWGQSGNYNCPNQPPTGSVSGSCDAAGQLYVTINVSDPDGNLPTPPGYSYHIDNFGDTGVTYWTGSTVLGPYFPPRNGVTYSIFIHVVDAQTGGVYGPFYGNYTCPPPPTPPTCSLSVNPALVAPNGSSTLSWWSANATSFTVDQGVGALSPVAGGSKLVFPGGSSKTYTGTATGPGGSVNCSTTLTVGSVGCSLNTIFAIEPGETYTPNVSLSYTGGAATVSATTIVTVSGFPPRTNTIGGPVPGNFSITIPVGPAFTFPVVGNYPVTSSTSGTVNGVAYGPIDCNTAVLVVPVVLKSYFKVFNGGITVGAGFNSGTTTCTSSGTGQVSGFAASSPNFHGASTQYDLKALAPVANTFYSSGAQPTSQPNFKALTFANNASSGTYGGGFGGTSCITDYYTTTKKTVTGSYPSENGNINIANSVAGAVNDQIESIGSRTFVGGHLTAGKRLVIYITGNVYITNDITLGASYNTVADIPFFALVVKGNIMIDPSVTQLDGLYIAQPNTATGTGGTIYTCATSETTIPAAAALFGTCGTKLTFNGSVVAKSIKLLRTNGTLKNGPANETAASGNIAEVFNGMPELFIANPAFKIDETSTELYDSITSLPPLL